MKKINAILLSSVLMITSSLGMVSPLYAAATTTPSSSQGLSTGLQIGCPANYTQFVSVDLGSATSTSVQAGSILKFQAQVTNTTDFPLSSLSIFTRVARIGPFPTIAYNQPIPFQGNSFSLLPHQSTQVTLTWAVPQNELPGTYRLETQVLSAGMLAVGGSISDISSTATNATSTSGSLAFKVTGTDTQYISLDNSKMSIGAVNISSQYVLSAKGSVVSVPVVDNLSMATSVPVTWTVSRWNSPTSNDIVEKVTQNVFVIPNKTVLATYAIQANSQPQYTVSATVNWKGVSSTAVAPLYHPAQNASDKITSATLSDSPFAQTGSLSAIGCVTLPAITGPATASSSISYDPQRLGIALQDDATGQIIGTYTYALPSRKAGVDQHIGFNETIPVTTTSYKGIDLIVGITSASGLVLQSIVIPYNCQTFSTACATSTNVPSHAILYGIILLLILLVLIGLVIEIIKKLRKTQGQNQTNQTLS